MTTSLVEAIEHVIVRKTDGIDPLDVEEIKSWTTGQVKRLLNHLNVKIWHKRQKGKPVEVNRVQYVAACKTLGVAESQVGEAIDLDGAKVVKKALLRYLHPDTNGGDTSMTGRYQEVINAYDTIENYVKVLDLLKKSRKPYKKRVKHVA